MRFSFIKVDILLNSALDKQERTLRYHPVPIVDATL